MSKNCLVSTWFIDTSWMYLCCFSSNKIQHFFKVCLKKKSTLKAKSYLQGPTCNGTTIFFVSVGIELIFKVVHLKRHLLGETLIESMK